MPSARYIQDVSMAIVMEALGSVSVTLTGVVFYVIKVSTECQSFTIRNR